MGNKSLYYIHPLFKKCRPRHEWFKDRQFNEEK